MTVTWLRNQLVDFPLRGYKTWKALGFQVVKGQKAVAVDEQGVYLFGRNQVVPIEPMDYDFESEYEEGQTLLGGDPQFD